MRFLADENIPNRTIDILKLENIDIVSIKDIAIGSVDEEIIRIANEMKRFVITFDKDFGFLVYNVKLKTEGIILLRFTPNNPEKIAEKIMLLLTKDHISFSQKFIILEENRIRVKEINSNKV